MAVQTRLRRRAQSLVNPSGNSYAARARAGRFESLFTRFPDIRDMRVLDLGGEAPTWLNARLRPAEVTMLNLDWKAHEQRAAVETAGAEGWMRAVGGDACDPPGDLRAERFDLVFSNSVIEHLGGHIQRLRFAEVARTLGAHHWVQTPNRYFPIEPHVLCPGFQFLPLFARETVARHWPIGSLSELRDASDETVVGEILGIELLSPREMTFYFPGSEILRERVGPLTKSLVAVG